MKENGQMMILMKLLNFKNEEVPTNKLTKTLSWLHILGFLNFFFFYLKKKLKTFF